MGCGTTDQEKRNQRGCEGVSKESLGTDWDRHTQSEMSLTQARMAAAAGSSDGALQLAASGIDVAAARTTDIRGHTRDDQRLLEIVHPLLRRG
jgi:hypothetical protein